jgi:hypothetical protein
MDSHWREMDSNHRYLQDRLPLREGFFASVTRSRSRFRCEKGSLFNGPIVMRSFGSTTAEFSVWRLSVKLSQKANSETHQNFAR